MKVVVGLLAAVVVALGAAAPAAAEVVWLCQPGMGSNPCVGDLTVTAPRTGAVTRPRVATAPKIDCFYVYPTVSSELGPNASKAITAELKAIAEYQARQFSRVCNVFAPVYRQVPVLSRLLGAEPASALAYADVEEAFGAYLREHPRRGFVLLGHSQGATLLRALIRNQVDARPKVRRRLVSAILPGANVLTRAGRDSGGDFVNVPACRGRGQAQCVAAWSTFNAAPPGDTRYGRPPAEPSALGLPGGPGLEVLCTNPATLDGSRNRRLSTLVPSMPVFPGLLGVAFLQTYDGRAPHAGTPWVRPVDRYSARCATDGGANVLRIEPLAGVQEPLRPAPDDTWGLHLLDFNIGLGNLVGAVRAQTRGYRAVRLRVRRRGARTVVTILTSPGSRVRITQRLNGRRTARRTVDVPTGRARVTLPAKRLRHYTLRAKRLN